MTIDEFRKYLKKKIQLPTTILVTVKPCLSIAQVEPKCWKAYGYCQVSSMHFDEVLVEGYRAKSEIPLTKDSEEKMLTDLLYEELKNIFVEMGISNIEWKFEKVSMVPWGSWN